MPIGHQPTGAAWTGTPVGPTSAPTYGQAPESTTAPVVGQAPGKTTAAAAPTYVTSGASKSQSVFGLAVALGAVGLSLATL